MKPPNNNKSRGAVCIEVNVQYFISHSFQNIIRSLNSYILSTFNVDLNGDVSYNVADLVIGTSYSKDQEV